LEWERFVDPWEKVHVAEPSFGILFQRCKDSASSARIKPTEFYRHQGKRLEMVPVCREQLELIHELLTDSEQRDAALAKAVLAVERHTEGLRCALVEMKTALTGMNRWGDAA
jgi:hypothetical protein